MHQATISADIIRSTSLKKDEVLLMQNHLQAYLNTVESKFSGCWGRILRGDCIECVVPKANLALRLALMLKCHVKAYNANADRYVRAAFGPRFFFNRFGVRIAIGIGKLRTYDRENGVIDGSAIYSSGRTLDSMSRRMRTNIVVAGAEKRTTLLVLQTIAMLCDMILTRATSKQCEVLFMRMQDMSEIEISRRLNISQVAVNSHLRRAGWYALEQAIMTFEEII